MKNITKFILAVIISFTMALAGLTNVNALTLQEGAEAARCEGCPTELFTEQGVFRKITNTILYVVGIIAVIMLIWGGIRYIISGGDSKKVTDAKNTILYAIIGMIICVLSYSIVNFVMDAIPGSAEEVEKSANEESSLLLTDAVNC